MIYSGTYSDGKGGKALVMTIRIPGQRWHHLCCFGRLGHYYEDGGCEHTDLFLANVTGYGKTVVKVQPFGDGKRKPKRFAKRRAVAA